MNPDPKSAPQGARGASPPGAHRPVLLGVALVALVAGVALSPLACPRRVELHLPDRVAAPVPAGPVPLSPTPVCIAHGPPEVVGRLPAGALDEVSGLVVSPTQPRVLWMHNDSGDGANLYAVSREGLLLGVLELEGAPARDWEDLAYGPCPAALATSGGCLWVGDVGDNLARRDDARLLVVPEPAVDPRAPFGTLRTKAWIELPLRFPDGPRDCEGLAIRPDGLPILVTKGRGGSPRAYRLPSVEPAAEPTVLEPLGEVALPSAGGFLSGMITAAALHPSGGQLLLRTYGAVHEVDLAAGALETEFAIGAHRILPSAAEPQGEAIAYDPEDGGFFTVSERRSEITRVPCLNAR